MTFKKLCQFYSGESSPSRIVRIPYFGEFPRRSDGRAHMLSLVWEGTEDGKLVYRSVLSFQK